jgi:hypothetical protein
MKIVFRRWLPLFVIFVMLLGVMGSTFAYYVVKNDGSAVYGDAIAQIVGASGLSFQMGFVDTKVSEEDTVTLDFSSEEPATGHLSIENNSTVDSYVKVRAVAVWQETDESGATVQSALPGNLLTVSISEENAKWNLDSDSGLWVRTDCLLAETPLDLAVTIKKAVEVLPPETEGKNVRVKVYVELSPIPDEGAF